MVRTAMLGFSVHTGWAALIAVAGEDVVHRARIEMMDDDPALPRFVYHAAQALPLAEAERRVRASEARALANAKTALQQVIAAHPARGAAIVVGDRAGAPSLAEILASHPAIHTAEGNLFRVAIQEACTSLGLAVTAVRAGELTARGAQALGIPVGALPKRLEAIGRAVGRPWSKDQKDAFLAVLAARR